MAGQLFYVGRGFVVETDANEGTTPVYHGSGHSIIPPVLGIGSDYLEENLLNVYKVVDN